MFCYVCFCITYFYPRLIYTIDMIILQKNKRFIFKKIVTVNAFIFYNFYIKIKAFLLLLFYDSKCTKIDSDNRTNNVFFFCLFYLR